jgi:HAD superfamily hydrolase (TIGR01509 family)
MDALVSAPSAFLFDLDGTLVDTADANFAAYARALREAGVHVDRAAFDAVADGRKWRDFLPPILRDAGSAADPAQIAARKIAHYPEHVGETRVNAGLVGLLRALRGTPLRTALVTTASAANARVVLDAHGLLALFDVVVTGDDVSVHKPDPAAYLLALARLGVRAGACVAFEDSDVGVASARAAGVRVVRVRL